MGEVISRKAATDDILKDVGTTLSNARSRKGDIAARAEERLGAIDALAAQQTNTLEGLRRALSPLRSDVAAAEVAAEHLVGSIYDTAWNLAGRVVGDPVLAVYFPGGSGYYTVPGPAEQVVRMGFLAELLETRLHPRLPESFVATALRPT